MPPLGPTLPTAFPPPSGMTGSVTIVLDEGTTSGCSSPVVIQVPSVATSTPLLRPAAATERGKTGRARAEAKLAADRKGAKARKGKGRR